MRICSLPAPAWHWHSSLSKAANDVITVMARKSTWRNISLIRCQMEEQSSPFWHVRVFGCTEEGKATAAWLMVKKRLGWVVFVELRAGWGLSVVKNYPKC